MITMKLMKKYVPYGITYTLKMMINMYALITAIVMEKDFV